MDERLWGDLREELLERVLARLPVDSFFRLRAVCRRWNAIMFSPEFLADCSEVGNSCPIPNLCTRGKDLKNCRSL